MTRKIETILCAAGSEPFREQKPCSHILMKIKGLVDERERRGGVQREAVITDSLRPLAARIRFAFVFGSIARNDQDQDSDIDLMLIGTLTQKEKTQSIKKMQSALGREVNPTIYSLQTIKERYRNEDAFVVDVVNNPKRFILTDDVAATEKEFINDIGRVET